MSPVAEPCEPLFIDGSLTAASSGETFPNVNPATEEVIGVSDRIAVMHEGAISGTLARPDFSEENFMRLAVGNTAH